jgi:hypothetical protein
MRLGSRQASNLPCPGANGTVVGRTQDFDLFCGSVVEGDTLLDIDADDLLACLDICAGHHPRCDGVTFNTGGNCRLKANVDQSTVDRSRFLDAAIAIFPAAVRSTCTNGRTLSGTTNFDLSCGRTFAGGDLRQVHQLTIDGCMRECVNAAGCLGFSFDASLDQGFKNCYLKSGINAAGLADQIGVDSGIINNAAVVNPSTGSGVVTVPVPVPVPVVPSVAPSIAPVPFQPTLITSQIVAPTIIPAVSTIANL